jgi:hypothetical protein
MNQDEWRPPFLLNRIRRLLGIKTAQLTVPAGSQVYLGAPAVPMDSAVVDAIASMVAAYPEVVEAHLPQCWVRNVMPRAAQILVIVMDGNETASAVTRLKSEVSGVLPKDSHLDIWPLTLNHSMLAGVRNAGCKLFERTRLPVSN